jgi:hypothetical protein
MPDLPWSSRAALQPDAAYVVMASHLPLTKLSGTVRFFRAVSAIRKQLAGADGLVGYTLRAKPFARDYWTLSVWNDPRSLRSFAGSPPHVQLMSSLKPLMGTTRFVQWELSGTDGRPSWTDAMEHLA